MVKKIVLLAFICFGVQNAFAKEYVSAAFDLENGNKGVVALILNDDTTFESFTRELNSSSKVLCEKKTAKLLGVKR